MVESTLRSRHVTSSVSIRVTKVRSVSIIKPLAPPLAVVGFTSEKEVASSFSDGNSTVFDPQIGAYERTRGDQGGCLAGEGVRHKRGTTAPSLFSLLSFMTKTNTSVYCKLHVGGQGSVEEGLSWLEMEALFSSCLTYTPTYLSVFCDCWNNEAVLEVVREMEVKGFQIVRLAGSGVGFCWVEQRAGLRPSLTVAGLVSVQRWS
ncbi:hypothetical protein E3N88_40168 [Mikania micrantha]|uniref:Uncharacterized protein n=1 Tax=Mikania micrantha TaxID=192012 RepID=A0A5N6LMQ9_9ASTR|nr:hypothetical protein E3N88_40168 [Mikania micrantha]